MLLFAMPFKRAGLANFTGSVMQDSWYALLLEFYQYQIATHPSYTYGEGFRGAHAAFLRNGLEDVVQSVRNSGQLPNV